MAIGSDILTLGPIDFVNFSPPEKMPFGGKQSIGIHKYIGGSRVLDTTGPDDADIHWSGFFFDETAFATAQTLDALRIAGAPLPLSWGGLSYVVVIAQCHLSVRRLPNWVEYDITCVVASDGAQGDLSGFTATPDELVAADIATAQAGAGLPANVVLDISAFAGAYAAAAPLSTASTALHAAAQVAASTAYQDIVAAISAAAGALDAPVVSAMPQAIAAAFSGLVTSAQAQLALVSTQGVIGRAIDNLARAGF